MSEVSGSSLLLIIGYSWPWTYLITAHEINEIIGRWIGYTCMWV